mmetsp:Transcript_4413/g.8331  ORF Transcript_4413/g.8331 Transcript_4413/m.8331 type:complete len:241 (+) Transcript_4413:495-1217(+)
MRIPREGAQPCVSLKINTGLNESTASDLHQTGMAVVDSFVPPLLVNSLASEMVQLASSGYLQLTPQSTIGIRDDFVGWLTADEASVHAGSVTSTVVQAMRGLAWELQKHSQFPPLFAPTRIMATHYPGNGAKYVAHRDNDGGDDHTSDRCWTCIVYCNQGWEPSDGGLLRCHLGPNDETTQPLKQSVDATHFVDVPPVAGTLVIFDSRRILHEVLPAFKSRFALTLWIDDSRAQSGPTKE